MTKRKTKRAINDPKRRQIKALEEQLQSAHEEMKARGVRIAQLETSNRTLMNRLQTVEAERNGLRTIARLAPVSMEDVRRIDSSIETVMVLLNHSSKLIRELKNKDEGKLQVEQVNQTKTWIKDALADLGEKESL